MLSDDRGCALREYITQHLRFSAKKENQINTFKAALEIPSLYFIWQLKQCEGLGTEFLFKSTHLPSSNFPNDFFKSA